MSVMFREVFEQAILHYYRQYKLIFPDITQSMLTLTSHTQKSTMELSKEQNSLVHITTMFLNTLPPKYRPFSTKEMLERFHINN